MYAGSLVDVFQRNARRLCLLRAGHRCARVSCPISSGSERSIADLGSLVSSRYDPGVRCQSWKEQLKVLFCVQNKTVDLVLSGPNEGSNLGPLGTSLLLRFPTCPIEHLWDSNRQNLAALIRALTCTLLLPFSRGTVFTLSGTLGAAYVAVGRNIPAVAFSAGNSTKRSYKDWNPEDPNDIGESPGCPSFLVLGELTPGGRWGTKPMSMRNSARIWLVRWRTGSISPRGRECCRPAWGST